MKTSARFWSKVIKRSNEECWGWTACKMKDGYGRFLFNGKVKGAHQVSWILTYGLLPKGKSILHRCDNPECTNPLHLFAGTQKDNMRDCSSKKRISIRIGEKNPLAKLTKEKIYEMAELKKQGLTYQGISERYNVSLPTAQRALTGKTWSHLSLKD
jgi:hypothetical protein